MSSSFSWDVFEEAAGDTALQAAHANEVDEAQAKFSDALKDKTSLPPEDLAWVFVRSPEESWRAKAGREGWLVGHVSSKTPVAFFLTAMN